MTDPLWDPSPLQQDLHKQAKGSTNHKKKVKAPPQNILISLRICTKDIPIMWNKESMVKGIYD